MDQKGGTRCKHFFFKKNRMYSSKDLHHSNNSGIARCCQPRELNTRIKEVSQQWIGWDLDEVSHLQPIHGSKSTNKLLRAPRA